MDELEKQIAGKILDRILSNEGITQTDQYDGYLQMIYDNLKAIQVQARVSPKVADILKICKRSLPNARVLNANPQFAKGWEDAYKQLIDYINDLKD